jgi:GT2 family glycosyltransferase
LKQVPLISIITINYKQAKVTNQLLASLDKVTWSRIEVIVVDNNSGEKDLELLSNSYSNVQLIRNKKNLGFARANNIGIKASKGDYILLLNNDTEVEPNFLQPIIEIFNKYENIGAVSPKIKFFQRPNTIQYAGYPAMNPFTLRMNAVGGHQIDDGTYNRPVETQYAHGCAMMVSREVINKVGLMPEEYFLYYEELDWSFAIRKNGFKIFVQPNSEIYHKESLTVKKHSPLKTYFINRNRILFMRRNLSWFYRIISTLYLVFISIPKNALTFLIKREFKHLRAYLDAIIWNVSNKTREQWKF